MSTERSADRGWHIGKRTMRGDRFPGWLDTVHKLLALCGLLVFVACCGLLVEVTESANDKILDMVEQSEVLKREPRPSDVQELRRAVLEQKIDLAVSKRQTYTVLLIVMAATSLNVSWFGFKRWLGAARPPADEMDAIQLEIARLQLRKLQIECDAAGERDSRLQGSGSEAPSAPFDRQR